MGKFKIGIEFDKTCLENLTQENNSGVEKQSAEHHISLHPIQLNNFNKSIKDLLNEGIAKYDKKLDGILLGYDNIKLMSNLGTIVNDSPYIHYDLLADFFVFKPEIGKKMQGIVIRKSKDHVGILVYNAFNVSLPKPKGETDWLGSCVKIGYEVLFEITFINLSSYLPYIKGKIISIISELNNTTMSSKLQVVKNKKIIFNNDLEEDVSIKIKSDAEENILENVPKHKKKKQKVKDVDDNLLEEATTQEPKKRKHDPEREHNIKQKMSKKNKEKQLKNDSSDEQVSGNEFIRKVKTKRKEQL